MSVKIIAKFNILGDARREYRLLSSEEKQKGWKRVTVIFGLWVSVFMASLLFSGTAHAEQVSYGILDDIAQMFKDATGGWSNVLAGHAHQLFYLLAMIELAWSAAVWVLEKDTMSSFTASFVKKLMWLGFFYALLLNFDTWVPAIISSFSKAGMEAAQIPQGLSPSGVVMVGLNCLDYIMSAAQKLGFWSGYFQSLIASATALFILGCFFVIALQFLIALVESYIVLSAGIIFLGFGGSRFTSDFVQKFLGLAVSVGVKLFFIYLIVGVGMKLSVNWANLIANSGDDLIINCAVIAGAAFIYAGLVWKIPAFASSLMSGATFMTAGGMATAAGTAVAATVATVATAGAAAGGVLGKAASIGSGIGKGAAAGADFLASKIGGISTSGGHEAVAKGGAQAASQDAGKVATEGQQPPNNTSSSSTPGATSDTSPGTGKTAGTSTSSSSSPGGSGAASSTSPTSSQGQSESSAAESAASGVSLGSMASGSAHAGNVAAPQASGGSISGGSSSGVSQKLPPSDQNNPSLLDRAKRMQAPQLPHDEAGGATVQIKLDHPHD